jgi:hypothetical protein
MAKKQTRRSISVSRTTYERLKAFCEANNISMSQLVETRVNDFLGDGPNDGVRPAAPQLTVSQPRPVAPVTNTIGSSRPVAAMPRPVGAPSPAPAPEPRPASVPMTSAAARCAVEPPPPIIKPRQEQPAPKPAEKRADQIFTF